MQTHNAVEENLMRPFNIIRDSKGKALNKHLILCGEGTNILTKYPNIDLLDDLKSNYESLTLKTETESTNAFTYSPLFSNYSKPSYLNMASEFGSEIKLEPELCVKANQSYYFPVKREDSDGQSESSSVTNSTLSPKQEEIQIKIKHETSQEDSDMKNSHKPRNYWLNSEDEKLLRLIEEHGKKWTKISNFMNGRNGKQVRDRYMNYLKPNIKQKEWTREEDDLLSKLYDEFGNKWSKIALYLFGRTENQIKNRFHAALRKHQRRADKRKQLLMTGLALHELLQVQPTNNNIDVDNLKLEEFKTSWQPNPLKKVCLHYESTNNYARQPLVNNQISGGNFRNLTFDAYKRQIECKNEEQNRGNMLFQSVLFNQYTQMNINNFHQQQIQRNMKFYSGFPSGF